MIKKEDDKRPYQLGRLVRRNKRDTARQIFKRIEGWYKGDLSKCDCEFCVNLKKLKKELNI